MSMHTRTLSGNGTLMWPEGTENVWYDITVTTTVAESEENIEASGIMSGLSDETISGFLNVYTADLRLSDGRIVNITLESQTGLQNPVTFTTNSVL